MDKRKMTKNGKQKPAPEMLGTGMARSASDKLRERQKKQECIIDGGEWVPGVGCMK